MQTLTAAIAAFNAGRLSESEDLCRQVLARNPQNPAALDLLGALAGMADQHEAAARLTGAAVRLAPDREAYRLNWVTALIACEDYEQAKRALQQVPQAAHDTARYWALMGTIETFLGNTDRSLESLRKSIELEPNQSNVWFNIGEAYRRRRQMEEAIAAYKRSLEIKPNYTEALNNLAGLQLYEGEYLDALSSIQQILRVQPRSAQAYVNLGVALRVAGDPREAIKSYNNALTLDPTATRALFDLITLHTTLGQFDEAATCVEKLEAIHPDDIRLLVGRARMAERQGDLDRALVYIQQAYEREPTDANVAIVYATVQEELGNADAAIKALEDYLETRDADVESETSVFFSLAKLKDKNQQYDEAFKFLKMANDGRIKGLMAPFSPEEFDRTVDAMLQTYSQQRFAQYPRSTLDAHRPIFIVGMPRSGTSLAEQILASHPDVFGAGELNDVRELIRSTYDDPATVSEETTESLTIHGVDEIADFYAAASMETLTSQRLNDLAQQYLDRLNQLNREAKWVTDKMPYNFHLVGFIKLMFPEAPIIHCCRDAMDTCLSCYFQNFFQGNSQTFDLSHLGHYYRGYQRIMHHWRHTLGIDILDLQYEQLVSDPEHHVRRMLEFCGLDWDARCLDFHKSKRVIDTASYQQVRRPIYTRSVARWKHYENYLQPLIESLGPSFTG